MELGAHRVADDLHVAVARARARQVDRRQRGHPSEQWPQHERRPQHFPLAIQCEGPQRCDLELNKSPGTCMFTFRSWENPVEKVK